MTCRMSPFHSIATSTSPASSRSWPLSGANAVMRGFWAISIASAAAMFSSVQSFSDCPCAFIAICSTVVGSLSSAIRPAKRSDSSSSFHDSGGLSTADFR